MKKLLLIAVLCISLFSCSNSDETQTDSQSKISQVLSEKDETSQRLMYGLLSKEEKFHIWDDKIKKIINSNTLSQEQLILMNDLQNQITPNLFDDSKANDEREIFKNIYVKNFLEKASVIFSHEFIYENFFVISSRPVVLEIVPIEDNGGSKPPCGCNIGSIWSCAMSHPCKSTNKCTTTMEGCGFATMFECNGNCFVY